VRLSLPPLPIAGTIDQIIERVSVLRARMLPAPAKPN
jgi:hypothetical protein